MLQILKLILIPLDKVINKIIGKGFGLKDIFTLVNLAGGIAGILLAMNDHPIDASYAVMAGFILGDSIDGFVARLTNHSNKFGSDFDTITDHLAQCIAPAFIVFAHFRHYNFTVAIILLFSIVAAGSIRHARNTAVSFSFPLCWKGLPRPIATMILFSFFNSRFFAYIPESYIVGIVVTILVTYGLLTDFPFISHHGRKLQWWAFYLTVVAYVITIGEALFFRKFFWDTLFLVMFVYTFFGWIVLSKDERKEFWKAVTTWKVELSK